MSPSSQSSVVIDTSRGQHARLRSVPVSNVKLTGSFWGERLRILREVTLPTMYRQLEETGRIDNFRRASGKKPGIPYRGAVYNDSDGDKWVEAVAWRLATGPDAQLERLMEGAIDEITAAQHPNGYLDTYLIVERASERWSNFTDYKLSCVRHLFQA